MEEAAKQLPEQDRLQIPRSFYHDYQIELNLTCGHRQLFLTDGGLLGVGAIDTQVGDEVWVLAGMSTPVELRTAPSGNYLFLGEAYVHGAMHGELADGVVEANLDNILLE